MKLLVDTHTFLWSISEPERLSQPALEAIQDLDNERFLSIASVWEYAIKTSLGRLKTEGGPDAALNTFMTKTRARLLPIDLTHALAVHKLPHHHGDPFDRLLVAQAQLEDLTLVSIDRELSNYDVAILW